MKKIVWALLILSALLLVSCSKSTDPTVVGPSITSQPADVATKLGNLTTIAVGATGEDLTFQWQQVTFDTAGEVATAVNLVDSVDAEIAITITTEIEGLGYRCIVSNPGGTVTSRAAKINIQPEIISDIASIAGADNTPFTFTIMTQGPNITYQWEEVTLDAMGAVATATAIPTATTASYSSTVSATTTNKSYRCVITNGVGSDTSAVATVNPKSVYLAKYAVEGATSSRPSVMKMVGDKLYVGLQKLDASWAVVTPTTILVIDTKTNLITDTITCVGGNVSDMEVVGDYLYVVNPNTFSTADGGLVERVSLLDHTVEMVFTGTTADITDIEHYSGDQFFVSTYSMDANWNASVPVYISDFSTDLFVDTIAGVENGQNMIYDSETGLLYIGEGNGATTNAVKQYNTVTKAIDATISTSLGISSMAMIGTGAEKRILVTETDYTTGFLGEIKNGVYTKVLDIHKDSKVESANGEIYILERFGADNLMKVSSTYTVEYQNALTSSYNPYAALISNGVGYLLSYEFSAVNTFDPATGILN